VVIKIQRRVEVCRPAVPFKSNQNERQSMAELLRPEAVQVLLEEVPNWRLSDNSIERTLTFEGFPAAIEFVVRLARDAEEMNHHPDIDIRWNKVKLVLSTHSAGGLTDLDFLLARKIDKLGITTKGSAADEVG
jgi:4a-hydroxytetrahydrobiopterin dehydratase